ncbi:MAG: tRNA uridine-5-carboxymethylaminomethyl(34) synthesis GTPase MnmE [Clostridiales bacterium]|uniref:tRNA uridine-5-carboxymethylaminomethyl(34) synthesis GTPase MnmE n=1 Tax=Roseburia sp. MSJ-14 TaxID=2841514 RepID=UPI0016B259E0|nr:tRNA uridine-5-carboxymethylaminomethyl(34) synthesis GTPase MnmE [Roseburia sp. MSJ-14]MBU5474208.1 tRNA uridine-5-carboxymethylaminomethyl(34) synthesis GTPase MnmE [Roseburia sp. MSJ-14]NLK77900.1 tRNA uridine-5-carboxymethylaminomethyl(34) synthesis GTPase MnmE [Clostridiales bacterium]
MKTDTIAAIATAMTNSGIGIVRISGEEAFSVIDKIYRSKNGKKKLSQEESHTVHYGYICDGEKIIDEVMVVIMRAPRSYTTEDTIEIDCHGGTLVMKRILETVIKYGARPAEPGEFTKRAFLNGRIDLSQAESVIDVINAKNDFALESSISQLQGKVKEKIKEIRGKVIHEIAFIESALDDPEHFSIDGYGEKLSKIIEGISKEIEILLASSENGELLKEGINTVIIGKPNAGKSSLMNVLLGRERAIVTDIAGTTRDALEEQINLNGITLNIVDTAGIRDTEDIVEKIGVDKAKEYLKSANLIIYVVDSSTELDQNDEEIISMLSDKKAIILLNKSDLSQVTSQEVVEKVLEENNMEKPVILISAKEQTGIDKLENTIKEMFFQGELSFNDEIYITNVRQKAALQSAMKSFQLVQQSIENEMPEDFYSIDLMSAYEELGSIIGEAVGEDLVNEIFSKFCMGK